MGNLDALEAWPDLASFQSDFVAESGVGELRLTAPRIPDNRIDQDLGGQSDLACLPGGSLAKSSNGSPRIGLTASITSRVASFESSWITSNRLLLPDALSPRMAVNGMNSTPRFSNVLKPSTSSLVSMACSRCVRYGEHESSHR